MNTENKPGKLEGFKRAVLYYVIPGILMACFAVALAWRFIGQQDAIDVTAHKVVVAAKVVHKQDSIAGLAYATLIKQDEVIAMLKDQRKEISRMKAILYDLRKRDEMRKPPYTVIESDSVVNVKIYHNTTDRHK